jgi:hypothetical protein
MRIFPGWRSVGRAMLEARRREGVTVERPKRVGMVSIRTYRGPADAVVQVKHYHQAAWFKTFSGITGATSVDPNHAAEALRVLAALDLIPADIAYAADERYGKCTRCGRLAQWVPQAGPFAARWCHLDPTRPYHKPVVAS